MNRILGLLALTLVVAVLGAAGGWYAARQNVTDDAADEGAAAVDSELSDQTLKNLGVTLGRAQLTDFTRHTRVQATVMDAPLNTLPLAARIGGVVTSLHVRPGHMVQAGAPIVSMARAPIARPTLALTADILAPVSENLHESASALRTATAQYEIALAERDRVKRILASDAGEYPTIRTQTLIDREYDLKRAAQAKKNAEHELERHGLSTDEIDAVRKGEPAPGSQRLWRRALEQNGLWGDAEESIHSALSQPARDRPWTIAAIGELSAAGLATSALAQALTASTPLASHFIEVAALLLEGHTLEHVRLLADAGALEPVAVVRAPAGPPDWDVERIHVRVGTRVDAGAAVAELHDGRTMWLRVEPLGEEAALIARAFDERTTVLATPLITNAGPRLNDLRILRLATREGGSGTIAYVAARNAAVARDGVRSWKLRSGLRYLLHVPVARLAQRFVVPASAVTDRGPDRVIYLPDGKTFRAVAVTIEYADDEIAVISNDGAIFANDRMVMTGAFALGLAMQAGTGAVDPHAGHSHD